MEGERETTTNLDARLVAAAFWVEVAALALVRVAVDDRDDEVPLEVLVERRDGGDWAMEEGAYKSGGKGETGTTGVGRARSEIEIEMNAVRGERTGQTRSCRETPDARQGR